jgi:hypothetical protein
MSPVPPVKQRREPTLEEEVKAWRDLAWHIDLHRHITMNQPAIIAALDRMSSWVKAHSDHNGERPQEEVQANVATAFWTKIAQAEPVKLPPKRGRGRPRKNPLPDEDDE